MLFRKKKDNNPSYKIPFTVPAFELFKEELLKQSPKDARDSLKVLFQERNNNTIHPKWASTSAADTDILLHTAILDTDETISCALLTLITKRTRS